MTKEIMIVTGEASGDLHGANLIRAIKRHTPDVTFSGMGGEELKKAGVEVLFEASRIAVVGFFEVISHLGDIIEAQKTLRKRLRVNKPDLLILIDFPDFNFILARKAKKLGIPIFYYISPQVWAWRSGRVRTMHKLVDKIGVILPFEEKFYRSRGVDAQYVGHPLLDSVKSTRNRSEFCRANSIDENKTLVGILPGSRMKEITSLLPVFLEAALRLQKKSEKEIAFLIPKASTIAEKVLLANGVEEYRRNLEIHVIAEERYNLMAACDTVIAASGTVTLELLLLDTPMVVAYKLSPWTYRLGKLLVNIDYFSLVNLIAEEELVTELLQDEVTPENISDELFELLYNEGLRSSKRSSYQKVRKLLGEPGASDKAAQLALQLI